MTEARLSVGGELQRAREERGLALNEVAQQLKFAPRQLEALEEDRFDLLPGGTFARGMVRNYARLLKLDPEPLLNAIADRFEAPDANNLAARYSQPVPFTDHGRRSTFVYLGLSLGVLAFGAGIAYQWYHERNTAPVLAAAPLPRAAEAPRAEPPPPNPEPAAIEKPEPKSIEVAEHAQAAKVVSVPKPLAPGVHRLVIQCEEEAWIEVKDANERMLVSSLNPAGAERVVRARGPLTLVIGNAEHVRVTHNDRPVALQPHTRTGIARFTLP